MQRQDEMQRQDKKRLTKRPVATIRDVASLAGVAPATVSNVLTQRRAVRPELKERVLAAIGTLGYRPNRLASSLRRMRSDTIGILVPDLTNPFFAALVHHLEDLASEDGYQILLAGSNEDETREADRLATLMARRIDGLIIAPARDATPTLATHAIPTVLMDRGFEQSGFDAVAADNVAAARLGCRHLLALGHRDIALVATSLTLANMRERAEGYRTALADAGLHGRARVILGGFNLDSCRAAVEQDLRRAEPPTAIFAADYVSTLGAVKAIRALDLAFPDAISLLGFDDSAWMTALRPYLSVVVQPVAAMATRVWCLLRERLAEPSHPSRKERLPCALAVRESTQRPCVARSLAQAVPTAP